jgi:hypothetical protein
MAEVVLAIRRPVLIALARVSHFDRSAFGGRENCGIMPATLEGQKAGTTLGENMNLSRTSRLLPIVLTVVVLAGAVIWSLRPGGTGCRTPVECLAIYRDACREADAARYRRCLGEPLASQMRNAYPGDEALAESLRRDAREVKGWVEVRLPDLEGARAVADVEEVRETGQRRLRFFLEQSHKGWFIVRVEKGVEQRPDVRYGTRVGEEGASP